MSLIEPLWCMLGIKPDDLTKEEKILFELELYSQILDELLDFFRDQYRCYFLIMKFNKAMENAMLDANYLPFIIKDIIATGEYSLTGIAYYTDTHEDVILEVLTGTQSRPSAILFRKIIELHRIVRRDLYNSIIKKIISKYLLMI